MQPNSGRTMVSFVISFSLLVFHFTSKLSRYLKKCDFPQLCSDKENACYHYTILVYKLTS